MASRDDIKLMEGLGLEHNIHTLEKDGIFYYHRGLKCGSPKTPVLVLIHGYPQTNFMWRHLIPLLPTNIPLFVPDIPGYGYSAPLSIPHSKTNQSHAILELLSSILAPYNEAPLIIAGHDRGARICHRLAVDNPNPNFPILGAILLDIVPTVVQWQTFSSPLACMGSYHWAFLANTNIAVPMIMAQGGDVYIRSCIDRWVSKSPAGYAKFCENDSIAIYSNLFKSKAVIEATCDDYRAGAQEDIEEQERDQKAGKKIDIDVLAIYSEEYLGTRYEMEKVWQEWVSGIGKLEMFGIGGGSGHFVAEEAPEETANAIAGFYERHTS